MKKIIAVLLASLLLMGTVIAFAEPLDGGWDIAENSVITEERKAVFDKAMQALVGVYYEPVAYLGSQVVAGTNHCFLCRATIVHPNVAPSLALVYIYEDLEGKAEIFNIADLDISGLSIPAEPDAELMNS